MDTTNLTDSIMKWFKNPKTVKGLVMYLGVIILLGLDFAYWAGAIETTAIGAVEVEIEYDLPELGEDVNYTAQRILDTTGPGELGGPGYSGQNPYTDVPFTVVENCTSLIVNLSCDNPNNGIQFSTDYDIEVLDPSGKSKGSGANGPECVETTTINAKGNSTLASGTWTARITSCAKCYGTDWHVTVDAWFIGEHDCGPDGCGI